jgi:hypothetical protein
MEILDFLPKYPIINKFKDPNINPYNGKFNDDIVTKKEFENIKLERAETLQKKGDQYNHQKIISRYMSSITPYDKLLLFHEMGTGKTCTAVGMIEQIRSDKTSKFKGALVIVKGFPIARNFIHELFFTCTNNRYIPPNWAKLTDTQRVIRMKKEYSKYYTFLTFETFARELKTMKDSSISEKYSNYIIVIDEVHNLREKEYVVEPRPDDIRNLLNTKPSINIYKEFHRFLHNVKEVKILLMSGTVMKDDVSEFASIMNLILPLNDQFVSGAAFNKRYFEDAPEKGDVKFRENMLQEFSDKIRGKVSYLKNSNMSIQKIFIGNTLGKLTHFIVNPDQMSDFQTYHYKLALNRDVQETNIYGNSRQAALFVFPDGTTAGEGFKQSRYIIRTQGNNFKLGTELKNALKDKNNASLEKLSKYSSKFATVIKIITETFPSKSIVYCEFVNGSGCILFSKLLEMFGFSSSNGKEKTKAPRYALLVNQTTNDLVFQSIIRRYNNPDNIDGEYISVLIGSRVISEGYTFKNVDREFIMTPHWNYSETEQVIARGWRLGSHNDKIKRGDQNIHVEIYQHVSLPQDGTMSIDLTMYELSEKKDLVMKQLEFVIKKQAFDCPLMIKRNQLRGYDGERDCEYKPCVYTCDGTIGNVLDEITYNIYYPNIEYVEKILNQHMRSHFFLSLTDLMSMAPKLNWPEVFQSLQKIITSNHIFINRYGERNFLRMNANSVFLVDNGTIPFNEPYLDYYSKYLFIQNGDSFEKIVDDIYNDTIPDMISALFQQPEKFFTIFSSFPLSVQRFLLQSSIVASEKESEKNVQVREQILSFYRGFYGLVKQKNKSVWVIWLHQEELGGSLYLEDYSEPGGLWLSTKGQDIDNYELQQREKMLKTPIGFYGQENPQLKEFCLRDVQLLQNPNEAKKDLRRAVVGRRCNDYSKPILIEILSNRIKQGIPEDFLNDKTDDEIKYTIQQIYASYSVAEKNNTTLPTDIDGIRRYIFYHGQTRKNLCDQIRQWLKDRDLIEQSFDCGTARKKRARIIN